ncbi:MAG: hypothetical protein DELT_03212 [Desulfovibrio sp.]
MLICGILIKNRLSPTLTTAPTARAMGGRFCLPMPCKTPVMVCMKGRNTATEHIVIKSPVASACCSGVELGYKNEKIGEAKMKNAAVTGTPSKNANLMPCSTFALTRSLSFSLIASLIAGTTLICSACETMAARLMIVITPPESVPYMLRTAVSA